MLFLGQNIAKTPGKHFDLRVLLPKSAFITVIKPESPMMEPRKVLWFASFLSKQHSKGSRSMRETTSVVVFCVGTAALSALSCVVSPVQAQLLRPRLARQLNVDQFAVQSQVPFLYGGGGAFLVPFAPQTQVLLTQPAQIATTPGFQTIYVLVPDNQKAQVPTVQNQVVTLSGANTAIPSTTVPTPMGLPSAPSQAPPVQSLPPSSPPVSVTQSQPAALPVIWWWNGSAWVQLKQQ